MSIEIIISFDPKLLYERHGLPKSNKVITQLGGIIARGNFPIMTAWISCSTMLGMPSFDF